MAQKIVKILSMILLACVIIASLAQIVLAADTATVSPNMFDSISDSSGAATSVTNAIGAILNITKIVGMGVAVIMLIVVAIKYISAAPSDKADIKKHAVTYVVGAVVLFGASGLIAIIQKFTEANIKAA